MSPARKRRTFVAIDGTALAYRSHFAFINRPLTTRDGEVTSAVYGFILALRRIVEDLAPDRLVVVFDAPGPTFRHEMFDEYKAQRERMPDDLRGQLPHIEAYLDAAGIPRLAVEGVEADDVLATLARRAEAAGLAARIVSSDKDLLQVVSGDVAVVQLSRASEPPRVLDAAGVRGAFGVDPGQIVDFLALTGDSSDNVPGVPGVGKKTAAKLLGEHGTLDALLEAAPGLKKSKMKENLLAARDTVLFSRGLVELRTDVPTADPDSFVPGEPDGAALDALFDALDFQSLRREVDRTRPSDDAGWDVATTRAELEDLAARARAAGSFALRTLVAGADPLREELLGLAIATAEGRATFVPLAVAAGPNASHEDVAEILGPVLADGRLAVWGHDVKRDRLALGRRGLEPAGIDFDAMLASYVLDASRGSHGLPELARDRLDVAVLARDQVTGTGRRRVALAEADPGALARHAAEEADVAHRLRAVLEPEIDAIDGAGVLRSIELPLVDVLVGMERTGVRVDAATLARLSKEMEAELEDLRERAWRAAGREFNLGSPKQVSELLFGELGLRPRGRTKTGLSTNADVLAQLAAEHEVPGLVLRHREISKLKSGYVDALPALVNPDTGRVHTSFQQAVAATGRLSSADPNLQNVPVRTSEGRRIREAFVPSEEGRVIVSCDYSQIELRLLAHMAQDEPLLEAFREDRDVHRATAALVFDVPEKKVSAEERARAKTINFAVIYGMGAVNLGRALSITTKEASRFIRAYFERYPGVRHWIDETRETARETLVVETLAGRRRPIPEIASPDHRTRAFGERIAVNTPIQGTAADIMKLAMIAVDARLRERGLGARMILTVHDELVFDCPEEERPELVDLVSAAMAGAIELSVPLKVDAGWGANWSEAH